jgi:hypothetical protein
MTELIVAFRNMANAPKIEAHEEGRTQHAQIEYLYKPALFLAHCPSQLHPLVQQIRNYTVADLTNLYKKYKRKRTALISLPEVAVFFFVHNSSLLYLHLFLYTYIIYIFIYILCSYTCR